MDLERMLRALGEPARLRIFLLLLERRHCVRSLSRHLGVTEPAVSQHLKVMREAGLVRREKYGRHTHYLPDKEAAAFLEDTFHRARLRAVRLEQESPVCQCAHNKEGK